MDRNNFVVMIAVVLLMCSGAYADSMPIAGSTTGAYETPVAQGSITTTLTTNDTWNFNNGQNSSGGTLVYNDTSPSTSFGSPTIPTPASIYLGSLTLTDLGNGGLGAGSYSATLDLTVAFTTPSGGSALLVDPLTLDITNGSNGYKLALTGLPTDSFTIGGETYTVTVTGLYTDSTLASLINDPSCTSPGSAGTTNCLFASNSSTSPVTGYLGASVTSSGSSTFSTGGGEVPEPTSVVLLGTVFLGITQLVRKRAVRKA